MIVIPGKDKEMTMFLKPCENTNLVFDIRLPNGSLKLFENQAICPVFHLDHVRTSAGRSIGMKIFEKRSDNQLGNALFLISQAFKATFIGRKVIKLERH